MESFALNKAFGVVLTVHNRKFKQAETTATKPIGKHER